MKILELKNLTKKYGSLTALDQVDLTLETGQIVGLLGPNGSGKSTMIKLAAGLLQPTEGELLINGMAPCPETKAITAYLPDRDFLPDYMNSRQLIDFYEDFFTDFRRDKAEKMLDELGLDKEMSLKKMSKGTKEKVQLILTMSREAKICFLDEPIAGVDPASRDFILRTIISNYSEDALVVLSTHLITDIEAVLDDVVFLQNGRVVMHKKADEVREQDGKSVAALFREGCRC